LQGFRPLGTFFRPISRLADGLAAADYTENSDFPTAGSPTRFGTGNLDGLVGLVVGNSGAEFRGGEDSVNVVLQRVVAPEADFESVIGCRCGNEEGDGAERVTVATNVARWRRGPMAIQTATEILASET